MSTPLGTTSYSPGSHAAAVSRAWGDTAIRWSSRSARNPQSGVPPFIQPSLPCAWNVPTIGPRQSATAATAIAGVIGSWTCSTSKRSRASARLTRGIVRGESTMFGSVPFAGTITERPTGMISGGGRSWRPRRGCRTRVKLPGGSLPMIVRVSTPCPRRASACSSACSTTAPQKDQEYGTTMPTFMRKLTREPVVAVLDVRVLGEAGVGLLALRRFTLDTGTVALRELRLEIADAAACAWPDSKDRTRAVAGAHDDVLGPRRAMKEIPGLERPFLTFDQQQRFALEHEEALLVLVFRVVHAGRLSGLENTDVDSELGELRIAHALEPSVGAEGAFEPARLADVQDEPALAFRRETFACLLDRSLRDHPRILPLMEGLAELHTHLGGSVASDILWSLAHEQGIALPVKDFWEFDRLVTVSDPRGVPNLDALDQIYHWTELIQSSPIAVERSVHAAIGGAYRSQGITTLELRFNPMQRNRGGERDLDHIILAAIRGLDRASLEYPQVRAGLILMMDRTFSNDLNAIVVEKAISWAPRGIVGIDIAGPRPGGARYSYAGIAPLVDEARSAGLGVTIHVGEEGGEMGRAEIGEVIEALRPDRIGHGILAAGDPELIRELKASEVVLEICPTSNLLTKALPDEAAVRDVFRTFVEHGVRFTIATDGPEMMHTHLRDELDLLLRIGALTQDELVEANRRGHEASFVGGFRTARPNTPVGQ